MKTYSAASADVERTIERVVKQFYSMKQQDTYDQFTLENVTIGALFAFDAENSEAQVLSHNGYPAAAKIKITPLDQRALGMPDAVITIDRACWMSMKHDECDALIDHELHHLVREIDEDSGRPCVDAMERPKLTARKHDRQFGWFDAIAERHGEKSMEVKQARSLLSETDQLYFDFNMPLAVDTARGIQTLRGLKAAVEKAGGKDVKVGEPDDALLPDAIEYVRSSGRTSISGLQVQMKIGYNRAARMLEAMEARGVVGPLPQVGNREVIQPSTAH